MKKTILSTLTLMAISIGVNAQNVNIPDANFKAYLVGNTAINTSGDTEIQVSEASAFTGQIICQNQSISDLTGIEAFTSLTSLNCSNNSLTSLDVSQNTGLTTLSFNNNLLNTINTSQNLALTNLFCLNNSLTSLDVSQNTALLGINCNGNALASLDVSQNTALTDLYCSSNSLASIDITLNTALTAINCDGNSLTSLNVANGNNSNYTFFRATNNPNLTCIQVDDVAYSTTNWTNIDATASFSTNCAAPCVVNIPDANFKAYLVGNAAINTNGDTEIQCSEASAVTYISCNGLSISDLTGIEAFTSLGLFYCENNLLTNIDVSSNTSLTTLYCKGNQLTSLSTASNPLLTNLRCHENMITSLDVSTNTDLQYLYCYDNQISNLDLSQNVLLEELITNDNNLTSLDITSNTLLEELQFGQNQIATIDLSQNTSLLRIFCRNTALTNLDCSNNPSLNWIVLNDNDLQSLDVSNGNNTNVGFFWAHNNPNLTCIQVDDVAFSNTNWTTSSFQFDAASSFSASCVASPVLVSSISVQGQGGASTITTAGGTLQMEATVLPANADDGTYTWSVMNGSGSASIDANGLLTAITDGTVTVIANANDASGIAGTATITISNQSAGLNEFDSKKISIYPNPVQNNLFIELEVGKITEMSIVDLSGKVVKSIANNSAKSIDVSDIQQGVYILKVATDKGVSTQRFIKQ